MSEQHPSPAHAEVLAFLRERLDRGDHCLREGNARGALVNYDSALMSFQISRHIVALRETYGVLWANKALAHQQLSEPVKSQEAAMFAKGLSAD